MVQQIVKTSSRPWVYSLTVLILAVVMVNFPSSKGPPPSSTAKTPDQTTHVESDPLSALDSTCEMHSFLEESYCSDLCVPVRKGECPSNSVMANIHNYKTPGSCHEHGFGKLLGQKPVRLPCHPDETFLSSIYRAYQNVLDAVADGNKGVVEQEMENFTNVTLLEAVKVAEQYRRTNVLEMLLEYEHLLTELDIAELAKLASLRANWAAVLLLLPMFDWEDHAAALGAVFTNACSTSRFEVLEELLAQVELFDPLTLVQGMSHAQTLDVKLYLLKYAEHMPERKLRMFMAWYARQLSVASDKTDEERVKIYTLLDLGHKMGLVEDSGVEAMREFRATFSVSS